MRMFGLSYGRLFNDLWMFIHNVLDSGTNQLLAAKNMPFGNNTYDHAYVFKLTYIYVNI